MLTKGLAVTVIILFVGVGIQPVIATFKSDNSKLEEITVQFFDTDRSYNHTVILTKEQIEELENLINNFIINLDEAVDYVETEAIFKDTIVSLNDYGILPEGMSIEKAQRLVTGKEYNPVVINLFEKWYERNQGKMDDNENILCSIAGWYYNEFASARGIMTILTPIWNNFFETIYDLGNIGPLFELLFHEILLSIFPFILTVVWMVRPFQVGFELFFGSKKEYPDETINKACKLDIITLGLNGIQKFKDKWYGQLPLPPFLIDIDLRGNIVYYVYPGAIGFTGIKIIGMSPYAEKNLLLGSALWLKLGEEHP
jgi:hypothetical protein